jgi:SAM-dependent methyltransferase
LRHYRICDETRKAYERRVKQGYFDKYLVGSGIDIGCGPDVLQSPNPDYKRGHDGLSFSVRPWDTSRGDGNAQYMKGIDDESFDFVYSSHCLEHMHDPSVALSNWWRILKAGGYLVVVVPDEDLYEQGVWPSRGNGDHKTTWTVYKAPGESWSPVSRNLRSELLDLLGNYDKGMYSLVKSDKHLILCEQMNTNYDYELAKTGWHDQTGPCIGGTEAAVEAVVQKPFKGFDKR